MPSHVHSELFTPGVVPHVSAVTVWELADLHQRGRLTDGASFQAIAKAFALTLHYLPADIWALAAGLPNHHGDPVDRMLIVHAIHSDLTLVTADQTMREYPVRTLC